MAIVLIWVYLRKKRRNEAGTADLAEPAAVVPAAASLAMFLMKNDLSGKMTAADGTTALMLLFFSAEAAIMYFALRYRQQNED